MMSARVAEAFSVAARADPTRGGDAESKGSPSFVRARVDANAMGRMREKTRAVCGVLVKGLGASRRRRGIERVSIVRESARRRERDGKDERKDAGGVWCAR